MMPIQTKQLKIRNYTENYFITLWTMFITENSDFAARDKISRISYTNTMSIMNRSKVIGIRYEL